MTVRGPHDTYCTRYGKREDVPFGFTAGSPSLSERLWGRCGFAFFQTQRRIVTTKTEFLEIVEKHPELTAHGYGVQRDPHLGSTYRQTFDNMRQELRDSYDAFLGCLEWIDEHPDFESGWSSYTLKHEVENWTETQGRRVYVPQGASIAAAINKGLLTRRTQDDLGVFVG